jgi:hypothetical protein
MIFVDGVGRTRLQSGFCSSFLVILNGNQAARRCRRRRTTISLNLDDDHIWLGLGLSQAFFLSFCFLEIKIMQHAAVAAGAQQNLNMDDNHTNLGLCLKNGGVALGTVEFENSSFESELEIR